jgi:uncharacterized protein
MKRMSTKRTATNKSAGRLVGLISDTHGLVRPEALAALCGCDLIIHSGDIGKPEVLDALRAIAPVAAIKGNIDIGAWAYALPDTLPVTVGDARLFLIHNVNELNFAPAERGFHAVISGHSHKPGIKTSGSVLFVNPGSAGPRRFKLPIAVGTLRIDGQRITPKIIELDV